MRLLAANSLVLATALYWLWDPLEIILIYWVQAAIVSVTQRRKIRDMIGHTSRVGKPMPVVFSNPLLRPVCN